MKCAPILQGESLYPCATLTDAESRRIAIYYGAADTYVGIAYTAVDEIVNYVINAGEEVADDRELGGT